MKKLIIYGIGEFAKLMSHYFDQSGKYKTVAYCADKHFSDIEFFNYRPVFSLEAITDSFRSNDTDIFLAVGYKSMRSRDAMFNRAISLGFNFASMLSDKSNIDGSATIGRNCVVLPGAQIEPNVHVGDNCIVWSSSVLCHDSVIRSHSFIAAQSVVGGRSEIGERCFLGFNATIIHDIIIGDDCLIGAKSLVTRNIPSRSKCFGTPSKILSQIGDEGVCVK